MSVFEPAVLVLLADEGGWVDDPDDPGGATNYGISLRYLRELAQEDGDGELVGDIDRDGDVDGDDIRKMKREDAIGIYRAQWWDRFGYGSLESQLVANKVLDLAVNMGGPQAHKCLQRAARAGGQALIDDGILGPKTLAAINELATWPLLTALRSEAAGIYRQIVARRPASRKFLKGWLARAYA